MIDFLAMDVAELLPHRGEMIWLDRVIAFDENSATAGLTVRNHALFGAADTVPAWVGIEYMAQTIGVYAGIQAKCAGAPIRLGFLLGTRRYDSNVPFFPVGAALLVRAEKVLQDEHLSVFACSIAGDRVTVSATLNVYQADE